MLMFGTRNCIYSSSQSRSRQMFLVFLLNSFEIHLTYFWELRVFWPQLGQGDEPGATVTQEKQSNGTGPTMVQYHTKT